jgi:hypothetical protein
MFFPEASFLRSKDFLEQLSPATHLGNKAVEQFEEEEDVTSFVLLEHDDTSQVQIEYRQPIEVVSQQSQYRPNNFPEILNQNKKNIGGVGVGCLAIVSGSIAYAVTGSLFLSVCCAGGVGILLTALMIYYARKHQVGLFESSSTHRVSEGSSEDFIRLNFSGLVR